MTEDEILGILIGPVVLGLVALLTDLLVDGTSRCLWPRGLRWFPPAWEALKGTLRYALLRIFWPEKALRRPGRRLRELESLDQTYRTWAGSGVPQWYGDDRRGHWAPCTAVRAPQTTDLTEDLERILSALETAAGACPCGYTDECPVHCGSGHESGQCPKPGVLYDR